MCTIGVVFHGTNIHTFKQCDLIPVVDFNLPESVAGKNGVQSCIEMTRSSGANKRMWAGVNSSGVAFVAADANYWLRGRIGPDAIYNGPVSQTHPRTRTHMLFYPYFS